MCTKPLDLNNLKIIHDPNNKPVFISHYIKYNAIIYYNIFIETLYKNIHYLLKDIDKPGENDLAIENGSMVIEDGDLKLTGYHSQFHISNFLVVFQIDSV